MKELRVAGNFGEFGCHIYTTIKVSDDYTMNEVVRTLKEMGCTNFRLVDTMKAYVKI